MAFRLLAALLGCGMVFTAYRAVVFRWALSSVHLLCTEQA